MPAAELRRFATYCRSMATSTQKTIAMARQDLADARAAAREGDKSHPLTPDQALAIKCGLQREERLWLQLAGEIDDYLVPAEVTEPDVEEPEEPEDTEGLADLFGRHQPTAAELRMAFDPEKYERGQV